MSQFNTLQDVSSIQRMDAERFDLYYKPRVWIVNDDTIDVSIYGEPGEALTGTDGITSVKATRQLTSALSDFVTDKVLAGDIIELFNPDGLDNGEYEIKMVNDLHTLTINENWPVGVQSSISFTITHLQEQYTAFESLVPFHIKLDPTEDDLSKWGITQTKGIDALIEMSIYLCEQLGLDPKIGDRFNYPYLDRVRQYEVLTLVRRDSISDTGIPLHYVCSCKKTHDILPVV